MHTKPPLLVSASALGNAASSSFPDVQNPKFTGRRRNHELFVRIKKKSPCDSPTWPVGLNLTHFCCRLTLCRLLHTAAFKQLLCVVLHPIPSTPPRLVCAGGGRRLGGRRWHQDSVQNDGGERPQHAQHPGPHGRGGGRVCVACGWAEEHNRHEAVQPALSYHVRAKHKTYKAVWERGCKWADSVLLLYHRNMVLAFDLSNNQETVGRAFLWL